ISAIVARRCRNAGLREFVSVSNRKRAVVFRGLLAPTWRAGGAAALERVFLGIGAVFHKRPARAIEPEARTWNCAEQLRSNQSPQAGIVQYRLESIVDHSTVALGP